MRRVLRAFVENIPFFAIVFFLLTLAPVAFDRVFPSPTNLYLNGIELTPDEAAALEIELEQQPDDLDSRLTLMGYYEFRDDEDEEAQSAHRRHALWFIEHAPESEHISQLFYPLIFDQTSDPERYARAETLWLEHIERDPDDVDLLENAAKFLMWSDPELATGALTSMQHHQPDNPEWHERLGDIYHRRMYEDPARTDVEAARTAFDHYRKAHDLIQDKASQSFVGKAASYTIGTIFSLGVGSNEDYDIHMTDHLLELIASTAFEAGELVQAEHYARIMLSAGPESWLYDHFHHTGNIVLGRIAVANHDIDSAKSHLMNSVMISNALNLKLQYPDVDLARELLHAGESEVTIEYFKRLLAISDHPEIGTWIEEIRSGNDPTLTYGPDQTTTNVLRHYFEGLRIGSGPGNIRSS